MRTKDSAVETQFHPILTGFLFEVDQMYRDRWGEELTITSGSEHSARHSLTSLHYATPACAADTRIWTTRRIPDASIQTVRMREVADRYCLDLGIPADWIEVILESNHIHSEYQPKRA